MLLGIQKIRLIHFRGIFTLLIFAAYPVFFLYSYNIEQVAFKDTYFSLILTFFLTFASLFIHYLVFKNLTKATIASILFLLLFFSFGHVFSEVMGVSIGSFTIGKIRFLLPLWMALLATGYFYLRKTRSDLSKLMKIFTASGSFLFITCLLQISSFHYNIKNNSDSVTQSDDSIIQVQDSEKRDIYYVILDEYAGFYTLKSIFNYDNSGIYNYLKTTGFSINKYSFSNYPITNLSISSSLNMDYIQNLVKDETQCNWSHTFEWIQNGAVARFLKNRGYQFINFSSGAGPTNDIPNADLNFCNSGYNDFILKLMQSSVLVPLQNHFIRFSVRDKVNSVFASLTKIPQDGKPKFIFAHIVCPHYPYVFGKNGEYVETPLLSGQFEWEGTETYLNQLTYINGKIKETVTGILQNSKTPPIIIIQSDHGSSYTLGGSCDASYKWDVADSIMINERMGIINAYYLPKGDRSIYQGITPVNTFRKIFNFYFNASFPILEDKSYWSTYKNPFSFKECTDILKPESKRINQHPTETP